MMLRRTSGSPPSGAASVRQDPRRHGKAAQAPQDSTLPPWAGRSYSRPCSRRSGNRSGRSLNAEVADVAAEGSIMGAPQVRCIRSNIAIGAEGFNARPTLDLPKSTPPATNARGRPPIPRQTGGRFSKTRVDPSSASRASMLRVITSLACARPRRAASPLLVEGTLADGEVSGTWRRSWRPVPRPPHPIAHGNALLIRP